MYGDEVVTTVWSGPRPPADGRLRSAKRFGSDPGHRFDALPNGSILRDEQNSFALQAELNNDLTDDLTGCFRVQDLLKLIKIKQAI